MPTREGSDHEVRRTAAITMALVAGLVFGVILLAGGDWIPGGIIVVSAATGLAVLVPMLRKLCSTEPPPSAPRSKPVS